MNIRIDNIEFRESDNTYQFIIEKENWLVFAFLVEYSEGYRLETVGDRLLDLSKEERETFFDVYEIANKRLQK